MQRNERVAAISVMIIVATMNISETTEEIEKALAKSLLKSAVCTKYDSPTIAMSPARLIQAIALTKKLQNEGTCNNMEDKRKFDIYNPSTWHFCAAGRCYEEECFCYTLITGSRCEKFTGNCWMVFCSPRDCRNRYIRQLECQCEVKLHTFVVITGEYWYDEGLEHTYRRPVTESETADFFEIQITLNYTALYSAIHGGKQRKAPNDKELAILNKLENVISHIEPEKKDTQEEFVIKSEENAISETGGKKKKSRIAQDAIKDIGRSIILEQEEDEMDYMLSLGRRISPTVVIVFICFTIIYS